MKIQQVLNEIENELEFPVTRETVLEHAGGLEIDAPDQEDTETLTAILGRAGEETYQTRDNLRSAIRGNLSEEYIGRKYYDDRGTNPEESERETSKETPDESF